MLAGLSQRGRTSSKLVVAAAVPVELQGPRPDTATGSKGYPPPAHWLELHNKVCNHY